MTTHVDGNEVLVSEVIVCKRYQTIEIGGDNPIRLEFGKPGEFERASTGIDGKGVLFSQQNDRPDEIWSIGFGVGSRWVDVVIETIFLDTLRVTVTCTARQS